MVICCDNDVILLLQGNGGGKCVYAMDALFGLPRKKSAGVSHREPLHSNLFFQTQLEVDQYVADNSNSKATDNNVRRECI